MKVRRIDNTGDWTFGNGQGNYAINSEAIAQKVKTSLRSFLGDWFLDPEHGCDWEDVLAQNADLNTVTQLIKGCVEAITGVVQVSSIEPAFDSSSRALSVSVSYVDQFGVNNWVHINQVE